MGVINRGPRLATRSRRIAVLAAAALVGGVLVSALADVGRPETVGAADAVRDGSSQELAGASCWGIKQAVPAAADGVYWLQTPALIVPQQFYCDMTTDGGGWVLVGQGRDGWNFNFNGQGNQSQLAFTAPGPGAFSPTAYSSDLIDDVLNGTRPDDLVDGIRIRRALNTAGTSWQELRWILRDDSGSYPGRDRWSWSVDAGFEIASSSINGVTYGATNTVDSAVNRTGGYGNYSHTDERRWYTYRSTDRKGGFQYRSTVPYSTASSSYVWGTSSAYRFPFARVFLRPRIANGDVSFAAIGDAGTPEITQRALLDNKPVALADGVVENFDPNDQYPNLDSLVLAFEQIGNTIYVGGEFQKVQDGATLNTFNQPYLAAFDATTGEWIPSFNPQLDGTVFDLRATPNGNLIASGNFSNVNGAASTAGLAAINPITGAAATNWKASLGRTGVSLRPLGRSMSVKDGWLYVGGSFNEVVGGVPATPTFGVGNIARFSLADGTPDPSWRPTFDSSPYEIDASPSSNVLWTAGWFESANGTAANSVAAISTVDGSRVDPAGMQNWVFSQAPGPTAWDYQYTIEEYQGKVYQAGSQHIIGRYDPAAYAFEGSSITRQGGDFQALHGHLGVIYAGCHCTDFVYEGATNYDPTVDEYHEAYSIRSFGAWDAATGDIIPEFQPSMRTSVGEGPWEMFSGADGCMWVGGDFDQGGWNGAGYDYLSGFGKFCPRDSVAPSVPQNVAVETVGGAPRLTWSASTDNGGQSTKYEILRDDRVIASTWSRNYTDVSGITTGRYFVRAVDRSDNRSASSPVRLWSQPGQNQTFIAAGSAWSWRADGVDIGTQWRNPGGSLAGFATGTAPLGAGGVGEATTIPATAFAQYFARDFTVADRSAVGTMTINITRSDGAVVYLNGTELARTNVPFGPMTVTTPAWAAEGVVSRTYVVPKDVLVNGTNRLAVETHQNAAPSPDAYMDLSLVGSGLTSDATAPSPVIVSSSNVGNTALTIGWTESLDNVGVAAYRITRNGQTISYRNGNSTRSYRDQLLAAGTNYTYAVVAIDANGNESASASTTVTTTGQPPVVDQQFVGPTSSWQYLADGTDPGTAWRVAGTVLPWTTGTGSFGAGPHGQATTIPTTGVTQYFVSDFSVADRNQVGVIQLSIRRDDGFIAYLNGAEIARSNMPFGPGAASTLAWATVDPETRSFTVPFDDLVNGSNRLSIELHQAQSNDVDAFLDVGLVGTGLTSDVTPPVIGTMSAGSATNSAITLSWTPATDNVGVAAYRLQRDGVTITYRNGNSSPSFRDQQLAAGTSHTYSLIAVDGTGNESTAATVTASTL